MDFVKDVGDKFHDAIQRSVERKADDASGLRTPNVAETPATERVLRSHGDRSNPSGPEGASGDLSALRDGGGSSSQDAARTAHTAAPLTVLSLDDSLFKLRWKQ
eukprot:2490824-Rhodomonas_salina.1